MWHTHETAEAQDGSFRKLKLQYFIKPEKVSENTSPYQISAMEVQSKFPSVFSLGQIN